MKTEGPYDFLIVGLGAMGSAAAYHLASRGKRVLGLDQFHPPHTLGSSHGESRIIREAYFESPVYVPIVQRAYKLWEDLERESGQRLFQQTGGLMIGPMDGMLVRGARTSAIQHHLDYKILNAQETRQRFPALNPTPEMVSVWEFRAGILRPERCIDAHLQMAVKHGADLHFNEAVKSWSASEGEVSVETTRATYSANHVLFSAGAWISPLLSELQIPWKITRQILFWFETSGNTGIFSPAQLPVFMIEFERDRIVYGFPDIGQGVKIAVHGEGEITTGDSVRRTVQDEEAAELRSVIQRFLPGAAGSILKSDVCMYTNTPDGHFVIDFHPQHGNVLIASPCSGHGFKFSSAIGELVADLFLKGESAYDLRPFRINRF